MAEDELQTAVDILRVVEAAHEDLPEAARGCFQKIADKSRADRVCVIEFGELLAAKYDRED